MFAGIAAAMPLPLLSLAGWSIVPDFATKHLLSTLHRFGIFPVPQTQMMYRKQYALTFAFVVLGYLSYNLIDSARSMPSNFYQILSVDPHVDEQGLKAAFRQFAKKNHPDRPGVGRDGEEFFIMVRDVYEALKNPVVRFAYDRFGPDVLLWSKTCTTTREYIKRGLFQSSGYHIVVGAVLTFWSFVGSSAPNPVSFWRYLLYATFFVAEIGLILSPSPLALSATSPALKGLLTTYTTHTPLHTLFPQRLIHQHILFLHQLFVFLSFALSRVVPVLLSAFSPEHTLSLAQTQELVQQILHLASVADRETSISLHTLLHSIASPNIASATYPSTVPPHEDIASLARPRPFTIPPGVLDLADPRLQDPRIPIEQKQADVIDPTHPLAKLIREIEELIIENNIKKEDGPLRSVWESAVRRGRDSIGTASATLGLGEKRPSRDFWEAPTDEGEDVEVDESAIDTTPAPDDLEDPEKPRVRPPLSPRRNSEGVRASH
ncbi:hypothetical protein H0H87_002912 [Tephrocybe sp. NHM501043]|nr:hypothetical protein H0H87_002912 [Tephrocybe sp. NHM501043]